MCFIIIIVCKISLQPLNIFTCNLDGFIDYICILKLNLNLYYIFWEAAIENRIINLYPLHILNELIFYAVHKKKEDNNYRLTKECAILRFKKTEKSHKHYNLIYRITTYTEQRLKKIKRRGKKAKKRNETGLATCFSFYAQHPV